MDYLDSIALSDNLFLCSYPNEIFIVKCETKENGLIVDKTNALIINCQYLKHWLKIFENYLSEGEFVNTSIAYTNSTNVLKFTKADFKLIVSGFNLSNEFTFDKSTVLDIMCSISHLYIHSLCLTPPCTLIFAAMLFHFEIKPDFNKTVADIRNLTPKQFLDLIKSIIMSHDLSQNPFSISAILMRHKKSILYLYKLRCFSFKA